MSSTFDAAVYTLSCWFLTREQLHLISQTQSVITVLTHRIKRCAENEGQNIAGQDNYGQRQNEFPLCVTSLTKLGPGDHLENIWVVKIKLLVLDFELKVMPWLMSWLLCQGLGVGYGFETEVWPSKVSRPRPRHKLESIKDMNNTVRSCCQSLPLWHRIIVKIF